MALTQRQHAVLNFLQDFIERNGYCPSYQEIGQGLNFSSLATVHAHLSKLEQKGYLRRGHNQSRSIELRRPALKQLQTVRGPMPPASTVSSRPAAADLTSLPLVGRIAAGRPVEAIEDAQRISLSDITRNRATFVLEVRGESMIDDHIMDGDYVMVERRETAEDGQIVVALVDGREATLKRIYHEKGGMVRLQPANSAMPPILAPAQRVQVQGRVIGVLRKY